MNEFMAYPMDNPEQIIRIDGELFVSKIFGPCVEGVGSWAYRDPYRWKGLWPMDEYVIVPWGGWR